MATYNHTIQVVNGNTTDTYHPETNSTQVYDYNNNKWLNEMIGILNSLTTSQKNSLVSSINSLKTEIDAKKNIEVVDEVPANTAEKSIFFTKVGGTSNAPNKPTIQDVYDKLGDTSSLSTTEKTSLVASLNELANTKANATALTTHTTAIATTSQLGHVKPDGTTITINSNGVITAIGGGGGTPDAHTHPTSQIVGLDTALGLKAPLASPTFTGTPVAPTPATATNTTQIATTAFVQSNISSKANLASPTFTGTPTAPTAASGTNTTQIATTAFVQSNVSTHLSDYMPHDSGLSQYSSSVDANGFYRVVEYKRPNNTLHLKSTASNPDAAGRYRTITWQFYAANGTTLALTKTWTITYDANGVIVSKVLT